MPSDPPHPADTKAAPVRLLAVAASTASRRRWIAATALIAFAFFRPISASPQASAPQAGLEFPTVPLQGVYDPGNIFARIIRKEAPASRVYEDKYVLAFMDIRPLQPGHVLVISKRSHARNLLEIDRRDLARIMAVARRIGEAQQTAFGAQGFTIIQNNGAGQSVPHLHVHVVPRYPGVWLPETLEPLAGRAELNAEAAALRAALQSRKPR